MYKLYIAPVVFFLFLSACQNMPEETEEQAEESTDEETSSVSDSEPAAVAENLNSPWMIEAAENGFYVSDRDGGLVLVNDEGKMEQNLDLSTPVVSQSEGGQLGFLRHPEDSDRAFLYHSYETDEYQNRVVELSREGESWVENDVVIENIPGSSVHNGGRMQIGPDGYLYVTTGDAGNGDLSQDTERLAGKILRLNLDGSIPEDNPFDNAVYSYGHRNPQGMTWDDEGRMYATEHGDNAHDEINLIEPGNNYGWPIVQGDEEEDGMTAPIYHTAEETWAPSGMDYHNGKLYIATLAGESIMAYDIESVESAVFYDEGSRFRDIHIADDTLYALTNNTDGRGNPGGTDDRLISFELEN
ncbi:PQQ-dependent sugar dehydrogenase [Salinicoccus albus]|uniref:PQQ-dependent sugar dehydrogenase n=1 Tax=Salinicoccus albus TaxID=418756 RepID=UPI00036C61DA|nr:PQQ-dependent sugar dehydrogenase [Salinicoccus albus]